MRSQHNVKKTAPSLLDFKACGVPKKAHSYTSKIMMVVMVMIDVEIDNDDANDLNASYVDSYSSIY